MGDASLRRWKIYVSAAKPGKWRPPMQRQDFDAFREDPKTIAAVERKLLVISEAAVHLGDLLTNEHVEPHDLAGRFAARVLLPRREADVGRRCVNVEATESIFGGSEVVV